MSKPRLTINSLDDRHRIILASFVFLPTGKFNGRPARDITKVCEAVFKDVFHATNNSWRNKVSSTCGALVRLGLLYVSGVRSRTWCSRRGKEYVYDSPIYGITESGVLHVLSTMDHSMLPKLAHAFDHYSMKSYSLKIEPAFKTFAGINWGSSKISKERKHEQTERDSAWDEY